MESPEPKAYVVVGLGFGDEGKGTVTDYLARRHDAGLVVRFNGGPQAGHNVVTPQGVWHCFAQFGSGLFHPGTLSLCSGPMLVELEALQNEGRALAGKGVPDALSRIVLDPQATLITPFQKMLGQMAEIARGEQRRGTCGMGVGQTVSLREAGLSVAVSDMTSPSLLRSKLATLRRYAFREADRLLAARPSPEMQEIRSYFEMRSDLEQLAATYEGTRVTVDNASAVLAREQKTIIFEGAQGALLDRFLGFRPFITPSRTTAHAALDVAGNAHVLGVLRPFSHRHGPGPLVTESCPAFDDPHNSTNRWQGRFRTGWLDLPALRYGIALNPRIDSLAVTNLDRLSGLPEIRLCRSYRYRGDAGCLDAFEYERHRGEIAIAGFKPPSPDAELTRVLECCTPVEHVRLPGWREDISGVRRISDLPENARGLIDFIASPEGLGKPVSLISVGPTAEGKIPV